MERLTLKVAVYLILLKDGNILLSRRSNTGWQDGNYGLPSGHLEPDESVIEAILRETAEEIGIKLNQEDIKYVHTMHRKTHMDLYFLAKNWAGEPQNMEPDKCDDLQWFPLDELPQNMVLPVRFALENYQKGILFSDLERN